MKDQNNQADSTTSAAPPASETGQEEPVRAESAGASAAQAASANPQVNSPDQTEVLDAPEPATGPTAPASRPTSGSPSPVEPGLPAAGSWAGPPAWQGPPRKRGPRIGLIVWGLIIATIGVWTIARAAGYSIDGQLTVIALAAGTGLFLVVAAIVAALRRPQR